MVQLVSGDIFHHDVRIAGARFFPDVEYGDDPRVGETSCRPCFLEETFAIFCLICRVVSGKCNGLDGYQPVDLGIASLIDRTHHPAAYYPQDFITTEKCPNDCCHIEIQKGNTS